MQPAMRFLAVALLVACNSSETRVHLDVAADPALGIENYQLRLDGHGATAAPLAELEMVVPTDMVGRSVELDVWGLVAGAQVAYGVTSVTPVMHSTVIAHVTLGGVSCGTWCTLGNTACSSDGQITCEMQANGCVAWSAAIPCPAETPFCSNGTCAAQCSDECTINTTTCDSSAAVRTCGEFDSDSCRDWSTPVPCTNGQTCSNGACITAPSCSDGDGCDDGNACTTGDTCSGGTCAGTPKCTAPANADPTCASDGTCDFACREGYQRSGSSCVVVPKLIFISSANQLTGDLGGLPGADSLCQSLAVAAGRSGTFKAWLSDADASAAMRLAHSTVPYVLVDGTVVAADWADLTSGALEHAIDHDETGAIQQGQVWTGTRRDGTLWYASVTCTSWSSAGSTESPDHGEYGGTSKTSAWTEDGDEYGVSCAARMSIYCVEQ